MSARQRPGANKKRQGSSAPSLILHTAPGLDNVLWREIRSLDSGAKNKGSRPVGNRNSLLLIDASDPAPILESRIAEDVFALAAHTRRIGRSRDGLAELAELARSAPRWEEALKLHATITGGRGKRKVSTYRVISRVESERGFKRREAGDAVASGLGERLGRKWKLVQEDAQVEVWLTVLGSEALLGVRLTTSEQRHRGKRSHLPASLRPSVAAALVRLTNPAHDDVFLDPFCGAGTILVERALAERHQLIIGGDLSDEALGAARDNIGPRYKPLELNRWDATSIPLEDGSVNAIATNPPFGEQLGSHEENERLYPAFIAEAHRLLPPGGRFAILTPETGIMNRELAPPRWKVTNRLKVHVLGQRATIYAARRNP